MKMRRSLGILFSLAACCFIAGTVNHAVNTGEGVLSSALLAAGCLCGAIACFRKK